MKVQFLKDCGIYKVGAVVEVAQAKGQQYINGKFAEEYLNDKPVDVPVEAEPEFEVDAKTELEKLTVAKLDVILSDNGLSVKGNKADKVNRLYDLYLSEGDQSQEDEEGEPVDEVPEEEFADEELAYEEDAAEFQADEKAAPEALVED